MPKSRGKLVEQGLVQPDLQAVVLVHGEVVGQDLPAGRDSGIQRKHIKVVTFLDMSILREVAAVHGRQLPNNCSVSNLTTYGVQIATGISLLHKLF